MKFIPNRKELKFQYYFHWHCRREVVKSHPLLACRFFLKEGKILLILCENGSKAKPMQPYYTEYVEVGLLVPSMALRKTG